MPLLDRRAILGAMAALPVAAQATSRPSVTEPAGPWTKQGDIAVGGGRLHYAEMGDGEPLIVLHKLAGWLADWRHVAPALARQSRVIAFDLPGHGDSVMYGPPPYIQSVAQSAAMLLAALDDMGIERCNIAGNSLGGLIGVVIAACWPQRVHRLAIVSASLIPPMSRAQITQQDADRQRMAEAAAASGQKFENPQVKTFATMDPAVTREHDLSGIRAGVWGRPSERGVGRVGVTDYLPRVQAPTLLVNADRGNYAKYADVGMKLLPHARRVTIPNAGSFVHQEKPAETALAINQFLAERD
jgi:pimeloyl-ACP methyl ester carboxylesterase